MVYNHFRGIDRDCARPGSAGTHETEEGYSMEKHVYREYHSGHMVELAADTLAAAIEEAAEEARRAHSDDVRSETLWVHGVVQALTEDGELIEEHPVRVAIDPEEPECKQIGL